MAQEEKLEEAKRLYETANANQRYVLESLFPELKEENKDEKIRKGLIKGISKTRPNTPFLDTNVTREEALSWLERQGEQKHTAEEVLIKAGLKPYKDGDQWCILLGDNIQEGICGFGNTIEDALYAFLKDLIASQGEQKPAEWNIFDFRTWQYIVSDVLTKKDGIGQYLDSGECKKIAQYMQEEWSKKLCPVQHPAEWSEKDKKMLQNAIFFVEFYRTEESDTAQAEVTINWLKSLRPRNRWNDVSVPPKFPCDILFKYPNGNKFIFRYLENGRKSSAETPMFSSLEEGEWIYLDDIEPQSHWKPSEEMLEALYRAIPENVMEISEDEMLLNKLYQGLKYGRVLSSKQ